MLRRRPRVPETLGHALAYELETGVPLGSRRHGRELRAAWERFGAEILAKEREPGKRPWAWWQFVANREAVFEPDIDDPDCGARLDDAEAESIGYLAAIGELRPDEIGALREEANEARLRIGTDEARETTGMGEVHGPDHRAVKVWAAIEAARTKGSG